ncbi:class B sortase [Lacrimispora sp.]|uniref:class B sortase n=1 Tax=Lacrimispora sp. TaxID=2719234 RepID=UPI0028ADFF07|nr:class B sortase [Lacrimispora sp.]
MNAAALKKAGRKAVRIVNSIVDLLVLTVILLLVAVAVYSIWDSDQVYRAAASAQYYVYKPDTADGGLSFEQLKELNPEVFGWLTVYGTNIDYPVTQGEDNWKYVNTNALGAYSLSGAIFLDYTNRKDFQDFNSILYGHHMEKQTMFGELGSFSDKSYFDSHKYGNLFYDGKDHGLEFFAFIKTDAYDGGVFTPHVQGKEAQQAYLKALLDKALYTRGTGVTEEDHILLMTTCSSDATNGRDILVARITKDGYINSFDEEKSSAVNTVSVDRQASLWARLPQWLQILLPVILLILLMIAVYYKCRRKRGKHEKE